VREDRTLREMERKKLAAEEVVARLSQRNQLQRQQIKSLLLFL
jgi:hypothetical protein